jgi:hypothetical protein
LAERDELAGSCYGNQKHHGLCAGEM